MPLMHPFANIVGVHVHLKVHVYYAGVMRWDTALTQLALLLTTLSLYLFIVRTSLGPRVLGGGELL